MSADNYIVVFYDEADKKYRGYMGFASNEWDQDELRANSRPMWAVDTAREACELINEEELLEYGFTFASYGPDMQRDRTCPHCGNKL